MRKLWYDEIWWNYFTATTSSIDCRMLCRCNSKTRQPHLRTLPATSPAQLANRQAYSTAVASIGRARCWVSRSKSCKEPFEPTNGPNNSRVFGIKEIQKKKHCKTLEQFKTCWNLVMHPSRINFKSLSSRFGWGTGRSVSLRLGAACRSSMPVSKPGFICVTYVTHMIYMLHMFHMFHC